jgi:hypothetical protein
MEVKPITLFVHDEIYEALLKVVPEAELNDLYAEALWKVFFKKPFGEVVKHQFNYSRGVPVRFITGLPTYLYWCGLPKEIIPYVIGAFNDEVYDLLVDYECGYRGGK